MTKQEAISREEAVRTISRISGGSVSYAEDLYDSFFEKPVVPQYVAGWIDSCKSKNSLRNALITAPVNGKIYDWLNQHEDGKFLNQETFALAWILGYTVEKEKRYKVRMRGVANLSAYLNLDITDNKLYMCDSDNLSGSRTHFTRKELEEMGLGEVFNSSLFEIEEVE